MCRVPHKLQVVAHTATGYKPGDIIYVFGITPEQAKSLALVQMGTPTLFISIRKKEVTTHDLF